MFIGCPTCSFKCDQLAGKPVCQNSALAAAPNIEVKDIDLVYRFLGNPITSAIVFGGLEPFDDIDQVLSFIRLLRANELYAQQECADIVIYSGYIMDELLDNFKNELSQLCELTHVIVKVGRYIPNRPRHIDPLLGVELSSDNQYAFELKSIGLP